MNKISIIVSGLPLALLMVAVQAFAAEPNGPAAEKASKPNVLFISIDDLKPMLGCYGDNTVMSPAIDQLASQSTVFLNAHCQFPVCGGSRASLMTGLRPESTGVMDLKTKMRSINPDVVTLPQHFRLNGYESVGVGKIYDPRCVDSKTLCDAPSWSIPFIKFRHNQIKGAKTKEVAVVSEFDDGQLTDGWVRTQAVDLIQKLGSGDKPFFLAVGFKKPHLPFVAPKKYWDLYQNTNVTFAEHTGGIENDSGYALHDSHELRGYNGVPAKGPIPESIQRQAITGYKACVSFVDHQVGLLLKELKTQGLDDNTIVVLWGDHGFHLGDHGLWGKHTTLEQATRVPMMIHVPGQQAQKIESPVELDDLFPTLAELAGLPQPEEVDGRSLKPIFENANAKVRSGALTVFKNKGSFGYSLRTERHRYTEWINKRGKIVARELYDYQTDPLEKVNLSGRSEMKRLEIDLAKSMREHGQGCLRLHGQEDDATRKKHKKQNPANKAPASAGAHVEQANQQTAAAMQSDSTLGSETDLTIRAVSNLDSDFPLLVGAATSAVFWDTAHEEVLNREFAYVTPANDFKQTAIHPYGKKWKWEKADGWIERGQKNGQVLRLHSPIGPQCSKWAKGDERTAKQLQRNLKEFMTEICKRYNGKPGVRWMDVVNETVTRKGEWFSAREGDERWENPWTLIGFDESHEIKPPQYIRMAFEIANQHAPDIKQLVNQHGGMEPAMWARVKELIEYLQDSGIRVDGLGWQAHIDTDFEKDPENMKQLRELIEWAQSRNLEFHITEFNAWINTEPKTAAKTDADYKAQAETYTAVMRTLMEYGDQGVVTWCAWQLADGDDAKRTHFEGCLFDDAMRPKPAFAAIKELVTGYGQ